MSISIYPFCKERKATQKEGKIEDHTYDVANISNHNITRPRVVVEMSSPSSSYYPATDGTAPAPGATGPVSSTATAPSNNDNNNSNDSNDGSDSNDTAATNEEMPAEELSRRMFLGGLLGLPWLWIAHTLYFRGKERQQRRANSNNNGAFWCFSVF